MILDKLCNISRYEPLFPQIRHAMDWLATHDITKLEPGTYQIDGPRLMVKVQHYHTVPQTERALEYHRRYIDLQCQLHGQETFGMCSPSDLTAPGEYLPDRDVCFPTGKCSDFFPLREGHFFIAFPEEIHQTKCLMENRSSEVYKAIFKLLPAAQLD